MSNYNDILEYEEEEILAKRAEDISQIPSYLKESRSKGYEYLIFQVNNTKYALEKNFIQELYLDITPSFVPSTPDFIKGIVNIRGEIVSVTDLISFFGLESISKKKSYPAMKIKGAGETEFVLVVDDIDEIINLEYSDIYSFPVSADSRLERFCKGVTKERIYILDMEKILNDEKIIVDES